MSRRRTPEEFPGADESDLLGALRSHAATGYPNPERKGCPGTGVLKAIAYREMSLTEAKLYLGHITNCSPCFGEYRRLRGDLRRRKALGTTGLGLLAALAGWTGFRQWVEPRTEDDIVTVVPDLRRASITRGGEPTQPMVGTLSRANLNLVIYLPPGSPSGEYEVEFWRAGTRVLGPLRGHCRIEAGIDTLRISTATTALPRGALDLRLRYGDLDWQSYVVGTK